MLAYSSCRDYADTQERKRRPVAGLKPTTGRPCVIALGDSGTVPAITSDCFELPSCLCDDVISTCVWLRLREQCLRSKITSVAGVEIVLLLRPISGNVDVNTLASKRSELIGNADILRMRRVIHNNSTGVCLRIPVAAITQKRKNASVDLWPALGTWIGSWEDGRDILISC